MSKLRIPTYIEGEGYPEEPEYRDMVESTGITTGTDELRGSRLA